MDNEKDKKENATPKSELMKLIFDDPEAKHNFVGFFDALLKIDMRLHPEEYRPKI